ncbi:MAG: radical SAM protein [Thermodesulfobacteriota bacterium]
MQPSRFNIIVPDQPEPGQALIYNTLAGGLFVLEPDYRASLERLAAGAELDGEDRARLAEMEAEGFVAAGPELERAMASHRLRMDGYGRADKVTAKVLTTMACNLACRYCFEAHVDRAPRLDEDAARTVAERLIRRADEIQAREIAVDFYGGEPLLNPRAIEVVAEALGQWAREEPGRRFGFTMTTNGTLLTRDMVERLSPLGFTGARVSLDGVAAVHDARRPFRAGGGSSHAVIMANLEAVADLIKVTPTVTVSGEDIAPFAELLDDLDRRGLLRRLAGVQPGLEMPYLDGQGLACGAPDCALDARAARAFLAMLKLVVAKGLKPHADLLAGHNCALTSEKGPWLFAPDGGIYKCPMFIGRPEYRVGGLDQPRPLPLYYELAARERWRDCLENTDCPYLPLCGSGNGCRLAALRQTGDFWGLNCQKDFYDVFLPEAMRIEHALTEAG